MSENDKVPAIEVDSTLEEETISADDLVFVSGAVGAGVDPVGPANG
jgi:hypothetical protein